MIRWWHVFWIAPAMFLWMLLMASLPWELTGIEWLFNDTAERTFSRAVDYAFGTAGGFLMRGWLSCDWRT